MLPTAATFKQSPPSVIGNRNPTFVCYSTNDSSMMVIKNDKESAIFYFSLE